MIRNLMAAVTLTAVLLMTGCATSRSEIKLQSPVIAAPATTATSTRPVVVIGKITDERVFAEAPDDPSVPTLGFGGADKATDDVKARAVGRKRNSWGKALGDVLLQSGQTVESVVRENLVAAFQQAGYQVKDEGDAGPSPLVVDAHIKQFWSWFTPGAFVITLSNNIATDLVINGSAKPEVVSTHVEEHFAAATEDDWMKIVTKGLDAYRTEVSHRMQGRDVADAPATATNVPSTSPAATPASPPAKVGEAAAPSQRPAAEAPPVLATAVPTSSQVSPASTNAATEETEATAPPPAAVTATPPQESAATAAIAPIAQSVATQLGCGAVQANGATTFIASCGTYDVLIDCGGGQCRPMHTVNVKQDE